MKHIIFNRDSLLRKGGSLSLVALILFGTFQVGFSAGSTAVSGSIESYCSWLPTAGAIDKCKESIRSIQSATSGMTASGKIQYYRETSVKVDYAMDAFPKVKAYLDDQLGTNTSTSSQAVTTPVQGGASSMVTPGAASSTTTSVTSGVASDFTLLSSVPYTQEQVAYVVGCMLRNKASLNALDLTPFETKVAQTINYWADIKGVDDDKITSGIRSALQKYNASTSGTDFTPAQIRGILNKTRTETRRTQDYYSDLEGAGKCVVASTISSRSAGHTTGTNTTTVTVVGNGTNALGLLTNPPPPPPTSALPAPGTTILSYPAVYYVWTGTRVYEVPATQWQGAHLGTEQAPLYITKLSTQWNKTDWMSGCNELNRTKLGWFTDWQLIDNATITKLHTLSLGKRNAYSNAVADMATGPETTMGTDLLGNAASGQNSMMVAFESWFPLRDYPENQAWVNNGATGNGRFRDQYASVLMDDASLGRQKSVLLCMSFGKTDRVYVAYTTPAAPLSCSVSDDKVVEKYSCGGVVWTNVEDKGWCKNGVWTDTMPVKTTAYFASFQYYNGFYYGSFTGEQSSMVSEWFCTVLKARPQSGPSQSVCIASPCITPYNPSTTPMTCANGSFGQNGCNGQGAPR